MSDASGPDELFEVIPPALGGERLDRVVSMVTGVTRTVASAMVERGAVTLDGQAVAARSYRVREGQQLTIELPGEDADDRPVADPSIDLRIVHCDNDVIVIDKQPGLVVHPGAGNADGTLVNGLLALFPEVADIGDLHRPGIVHRLDKETSGLMVVARTAVAYERLVEALSSHRVERRYLALVWGHLDDPRGIVDAPIGRSARTRTKMAVSVAGRPARTSYEVLQAFDEPGPTTLIECRLETGRTHQIRVHMAAIGHPVVGDPTYGGVRETLTVPRMVLHSTSLSFAHPVTQEKLCVDSPLPADLQEVIDGLE